MENINCEHSFILEETVKSKDPNQSYNFNCWHDTLYKVFRCTKCLQTSTIKCGSKVDYNVTH